MITRRNTTIGNFLLALAAEGMDVDAAFDAATVAGLEALPVKWNARLRTAAGRAISLRATGEPLRIELNLGLLAEDPASLCNTFLHELAHVIVGTRKKHNYEWKSLFRRIGGNGERCHDMELGGRTARAAALRKTRATYREAAVAHIASQPPIPAGKYMAVTFETPEGDRTFKVNRHDVAKYNRKR